MQTYKYGDGWRNISDAAFKGFMHIQKVLEKGEEGHMTQCQEESQFC